METEGRGKVKWKGKDGEKWGSNEGREEGMGGKKVRRAKKGEGDGAKGREKWQRIREGRIQ